MNKATALKVFGYAWLSIAVTLILIGYLGAFLKSGMAGLWELLSPFNVFNWILTVAIIAPGALAVAKAKEIQKKASDQP